MGAQLSRDTAKLNERIIELNNEITVRSTDFKQKYLDDPTSFCNSLALLDSASLKKFTLPELQGMNAMLAISIPDNAKKNELCTSLVNHFRRRVELMSTIGNALSALQAQLNQLLKGPYCFGVATTTPQDCTAKAGTWHTSRKEFDASAKVNRPWVSAIIAYEKQFQYCVKKFHTLLIKLADDSGQTVVTDRDLEKFTLVIETEQKTLQTHFSKLLVASATTPLYTSAEVSEMESKKAMEKAALAAEKAATRKQYNDLLQQQKTLIEAHHKVPAMGVGLATINKLFK